MHNIVFVIPTYNPKEAFLNTLKDLTDNDTTKTLLKIIVNDGSTKDLDYFDAALKQFNPIVIQHDLNRGKGQSIKTALDYIQVNFPKTDYILTIDSDGQHTASDASLLIKSLTKPNDMLLIGARTIDRTLMPIRSYIGNYLTNKILSYFYKCPISDSQSGLRIYPKSFFATMKKITSCRYEFETEALILAIKRKLPVHEIKIQTIYLEENKSSHFRPVLDSLRVLWAIIKSK